MAKQRHKRKKSYTVLLISNIAEGKNKQYRLSRIMVVFVLILILGVCLSASGVFAVVNYLDVSSASALPKLNLRSSKVATEQIAELKENISQLEQEKKNLEEQISFLSSAVSQKEDKISVLQAENEVRNKPTGFPLNGNATISYDGLLQDFLRENGDQQEQNEEQEQQEEAVLQGEDEENIENIENIEEIEDAMTMDANNAGTEEYIVVFEASEGVAVVATGYGTISAVSEDENFGHRVTVDHGNGYTSIYLSKSEPKVKEGAEVARGTVLFELEEVSQVGYQIKLNEQYENPLSVMEIAG